MNVAQLRELLEGMDDDAPVRLAIQPSWPLRLEVRDVVPTSGINGEPEDGEGDDDAHIVWIVASDSSPYSESPYAPRALWDR